jgi:hypothetical protein
MFEKGFKAIGNGAHEAEVSFVKSLNFSDHDIQFLNDLRYVRNGVIYYGKLLEKIYAEKVFNFTKKKYKVLL